MNPDWWVSRSAGCWLCSRVECQILHPTLSSSSLWAFSWTSSSRQGPGGTACRPCPPGPTKSGLKFSHREHFRVSTACLAEISSNGPVRSFMHFPHFFDTYRSRIFSGGGRWSRPRPQRHPGLYLGFPPRKWSKINLKGPTDNLQDDLD